jgi:hypothetical protein
MVLRVFYARPDPRFDTQSESLVSLSLSSKLELSIYRTVDY